METDYFKVCKAVDDVCEKHGLGRPNKTESMIKNTYGYHVRECNLAWINFKLAFFESLFLPKKTKQNILAGLREQKKKAERDMVKYINSFK